MKILPKTKWPNPTALALANLVAALGDAGPNAERHALVLLWRSAVACYKTQEEIQRILSRMKSKEQEARENAIKAVGFDPYNFPDGISHEKFLELTLPRVPDKEVGGKRVRARKDMWMEYLRVTKGENSDEIFATRKWSSPSHILSGARRFKNWMDQSGSKKRRATKKEA